MKNKNFITLRDNGVQYGPFPKKQFAFLQKALKINEDGGTFCVGDFPELTTGNFRQFIHKLNDYIEIVIPTYPKFYKIKGTNVIGNYKPISGKLIGESMLSILERLKDKSPTLNELKIRFDSGIGLYNVLVNMGVKSTENNEILWDNIRIHEDNVNLTIIIDPKDVNIEINCKNRPIVYDMNSILEVTELLGRISQLIINETRNIVRIPYVGDWICVSYTIGTNSQHNYNDIRFYRTWKDIAGGFLRLYSEQSRKQRFYMLMDTRAL